MASRAEDWSPLGFDTDPTPGEQEAVELLSLESRDVSYRLHHQADTANRVLSTNAGVSSWSGLAAEVFGERLRAAAAAALEAAARHEECATAARTWSAVMPLAQAQADEALREALEALEELDAAEAAMSAAAADPVLVTRARFRVEDAHQALDRAKRKAREAQEHYDAGERAFADALDATLHGALSHASQPELNTLGSMLGKLSGIAPSASVNSSLMQTLRALTPIELAALLADDPEVLQQFWKHPPSPDQVATWWSSLGEEGSAAKQALMEAAPGILGNLAGLPFSVRNTCNLAVYNSAKNRADLTEQQRKVLDALSKVLADGSASLVCFNLDASVPMVAVGYGNLDTADTVTWAAPGMGSDAADATKDWSRAAKNLYNRQYGLDGDRSHAVVGWLGYDTPDPVSVNFPALAQDGAWRFANELDGTHATRAAGSSGLPYVGVLAHSYGTTMAGDALTHTKYPVDSFTMLESAGIDTDVVHSLSDLHVKKVGGAPAIYTSAAGMDLLAPFGSWTGGRAEPNPEVAQPVGFLLGPATGLLTLPKTIGGARSFSSEGARLPDGEVLEQTQGHSALGAGHGYDPLNGTAPPGHGYLDEKTESLRNAALTTVGSAGRVVGGLTPTK